MPAPPLPKAFLILAYIFLAFNALWLFFSPKTMVGSIYSKIFGVTHQHDSQLTDAKNVKRIESEIGIFRLHLFNPLALLLGIVFQAPGPGAAAFSPSTHKLIGYAIVVFALIGSVSGLRLGTTEPYGPQGADMSFRVMTVVNVGVLFAAIYHAMKKNRDMVMHGKMMRLWMATMLSSSAVFRLLIVVFCGPMQRFGDEVYGYSFVASSYIGTFAAPVFYFFYPDAMLFSVKSDNNIVRRSVSSSSSSAAAAVLEKTMKGGKPPLVPKNKKAAAKTTRSTSSKKSKGKK